MPSVAVDTSYPRRSTRRNLQYVFTPKHHGADAGASCWLAEITFDEEFTLFDFADGFVVIEQISDSDGNLYGYEVLPEETNQHLRDLGTWNQQMAEYPAQVDDAPWHGYPIWPISAVSTPPQFRGQRSRPDPGVFRRMEQLGHITSGHRKRLMKGDFI